MDDDLPDLGLATLLSLLGSDVDAAVVQALEGTGLRRGHGYLVQRLLVTPATATELAADLGVSQQAVSKSVKELLALGHVEFSPEAGDRRRRPVRLSAQGQDAVARARSARADIDARIVQQVGAGQVEAARAVLVEALEVLGIREQVERRVVRPDDGRVS
jgi:DNA-binding MarR family transcriptional regulator